MTQVDFKLDIEQLNQRHAQERLLISSGAVFQTISNSPVPLSERDAKASPVVLRRSARTRCAIAMELDLSVAMVRNAIAQLEKDNLIVQNFNGDWEVEF